jgi:fructoselysine-6-P-deglycase FrlB-like protein
MPTLGVRTLAEIRTQPQCWRQALDVAANAQGLPATGESVLVLGCGTSYYIAQAYATLREAAGLGHTDAVIASEIMQPLRRRYDRVVAISRSGTSVDLLMAVERLAPEVTVTALLGDIDTPLAQLSHHVIDLGFADEESVVQTRFATTGLTVLRAAIGEDLEDELASAQVAVSDELPTLPERQLVVLAHGWSTALAQEGALKCREASAQWVEAYAAGEYRHGPLAAADATTLVWGLTPLSDVLVEAITSTGARVQQPTHPPQAELVRIQRLAVEWAAAHGRDADRPEHLGRSVVIV